MWSGCDGGFEIERGLLKGIIMGAFFENRKHDFEAEILFLPLGPTTRTTHPFNGYRWEFCFADDLDETGRPRQISHIWPELIDDTGASIPTDVPIEGRLHARMHIWVRDAVDLHRQRLAIGTKFYCVTGSRIIAEGVVTSLNPMARNEVIGRPLTSTTPKQVVEFQSAGVPYWSTAFEDNVGGCAGMKLYRELHGEIALVASLTYWDAAGYYLETLGTDLPLGVIEKLVKATKLFVGVGTS